MKRIYVIASALMIIAFALLIIRGDEDTWMCDRDAGVWVKHGNPGAPAPSEPCGSHPECSSFVNPDECPDECVVCPPCIECSSISCQTEEFCRNIGFDRKWYEDIRNRINSFYDCIAAGNPAMESYPRQCRANGQTYIEDIGNEPDRTDMIRLDTPRPGQEVGSPLGIKGAARGNWYFEGDFPVILTDWDGRIIAEGYATAQADWMTEEFVPFTGTLKFESPAPVTGGVNRGSLILRKDNPSDLPENDDALEIPVIFATDTASLSASNSECEEEQRKVEGCGAIYDPVCATVNIQCIKAPCYPVEETYSSACHACRNPLVGSYRNGECK